MKFLSMLGAAVMALSFGLVSVEAEAAKRMGGGKSFGMQRQATPPPKSPAAAPAQQTPAQQAPAATGAQPSAAGAAAAPARSSWMGPLAGLAAGLGLAALASHFGFGEELASMLLIGLLVMAVLLVVGYFMRRNAAARQPAMRAGGLQYAAAGAGSAPAPHTGSQPAMPAIGSGLATDRKAEPVAAPAVEPTKSGNIPADFDTAGFVRNAKVNFIRLQAANDAGNLEDIREFTTPEVFAEIRMDIMERGSAPQKTEVVALDAEVIDVAEESSRYIVSVHFSGRVREERDALPEPINEIWHMVKPLDGSSGWLLAGIQQVN